jgi:hypothetical protein
MDVLDQLTYDNLVKIFKDINFDNTIFEGVIIPEKKTYMLIMIKHPLSDVHISIFKDPWDGYQSPSEIKSRLFHITKYLKGESQCSHYFLLTDKLQIMEPPKKDFAYNQPFFDDYHSERSKCTDKVNYFIIKEFEELINKIARTITFKLKELSYKKEKENKKIRDTPEEDTTKKMSKKPKHKKNTSKKNTNKKSTNKKNTNKKSTSKKSTNKKNSSSNKSNSKTSKNKINKGRKKNTDKKNNSGSSNKSKTSNNKTSNNKSKINKRK